MTEKPQEMSRRGFLQNSLAASLAFSPLANASNVPVPASARVNIIYIHSHDSGRYLQQYGHNTPTPNLLRLAKQGVLFRQMHSAAPTCSPSRAALLTGQSAHSSGMMGLAHRGWSLNNYEEHILHTLRKSGYSTTLAGLQHIATDARTVGFDTILQSGIPARSEPGGVDGDSFQAQRVAPSAAKFIESHPRQPFFLDVGFFETHRPFHQAVDNFAYILPPSPVPDVPDTRADMAGFHASASAMDAGVGMVLDALAAAGLEENTLVISTTDHGISFPDMKCSLKDAGTGVSMIMRGPGIFSEAAVCDAMLSQVDVFPTICDYLGIEKPQWLQGRSFLPVLEKKRDEVNEAIFAEVTYHAAYEPKRSVRTRTLKYIRHFDDRTRAVLPNCDDGPSKSYWMKHGWKTRLTTREELYDLIFDPNENNNLVNEPRMAADLTDLRSRLDRWMTETRDPLLKGPVLPPPDGRVTSPDVDSPGGLLVFAPPPL